MWQQSWRLEAVNTLTSPEDDPQTVLPSLIPTLLSNVYLNFTLPLTLSLSVLPVDIPGHSSLKKV
jgi:hypothetical protein